MTPALQPQTIGVFGSAGPLTGPGNPDLSESGETELGFDLLMDELALQLADAQPSPNAAIPPPSGLAVPVPTDISQTDVDPHQPGLEFAVPMPGQSEPLPLVTHPVAPPDPQILVAPLSGTYTKADLPQGNEPVLATVSGRVPDAEGQANADASRSVFVKPDVAKASLTDGSQQQVTDRDPAQQAFVSLSAPIARPGQAQSPAWLNASALTGANDGPRPAPSSLVSNVPSAATNAPKASETTQVASIPELDGPSEPALPKATGLNVEPQTGSATSLSPAAIGVSGRPAEGLPMVRSMNPTVETAAMSVPDRAAGVASAEMACRQRLGETPAVISDLGPEPDGGSALAAVVDYAGAPASGTLAGVVAALSAQQTARHQLITIDPAEPLQPVLSVGTVHSTETPAPVSDLQINAAAIAGEMKIQPTGGDFNPLASTTGPSSLPGQAPGVVPQPAPVPLHQPVQLNALAPVIVDQANSGKDGATHLALSPEELGRMTITIRQDVDGLKVSLMAERPETLDLMRRHAAELTADLRQAGFAGASLHFGQSGQDPSAQQGRAEPDLPEPMLPEPIQSTSKLAGLLHPVASGRAAGVGLDIRF